MLNSFSITCCRGVRAGAISDAVSLEMVCESARGCEGEAADRDGATGGCAAAGCLICGVFAPAEVVGPEIGALSG